ncbi:MAG: S41 family peptidase [Coriobacteriia bacterium]|nr:S41 family peptidase [Coriobacteriia bacterium]
MSRALKIFLVIGVVVLGILGGFLAGFLLSAKLGMFTQPSVLSSGVDSVFALMQRQALDPPDETTATVGAINGLLQSNGDRYARYMPADDFKSYSETMEGSFGGIGVVLAEENGNVRVAQVYEDTPAARAGIENGDWFFEIDGIQRDSWTTQEIQRLVKGEPGTTVTITLCRPYTEEDTMNMRYPLGVPYTVTIERAVIQVPVTKAELYEGDIGYIRLFEFNLVSGDAVREDIKSLKAQGAKKFILDLRENPGGDLRQAISISSIFIESGVIVKVESRVDGETILESVGDTTLPSEPLVILIDENSASASEIVAGAIHDHERGTLVGMKTFGKGSVQTLLNYKDGAILMTTAHYLSPNGTVINDVGVSPDVEIPMTLGAQKELETDIQLQEAIKILGDLR